MKDVSILERALEDIGRGLLGGDPKTEFSEYAIGKAKQSLAAYHTSDKGEDEEQTLLWNMVGSMFHGATFIAYPEFLKELKSKLHITSKD